MSKTLNRQGYRKGAVSLYIVIFTTLLISIITISFIRIMLSEQDSATNADLSQSAYDSALAGVEDAKVVLIKNQDCINRGDSSEACQNINNALNNDNTEDDCDMIASAIGLGIVGEETVIQTNSSGNGADLNQAYTCVKIVSNTQEFLGNLQPGQSRFVPLRQVGSTPPTHIRLSWFMRKNTNSDAVNLAEVNPATYNESLLPINNTAQWPVNRPSLMRFQLMQTAGTFTLAQFDEFNASASNRGTLFLYPSTSGSVGDNALINSTSRGTAQVNAPTPVTCYSDLSNHAYACEVIIKIPPTIGGGSNAATSMLKLTGFYNETDFKVEMCTSADCSTIVPFNGVQPEVDSTGRANDLFRRVVARIEMIDIYFPFPEYEIQLGGDSAAPLCKNFEITDKTVDSADLYASNASNCPK